MRPIAWRLATWPSCACPLKHRDRTRMMQPTLEQIADTIRTAWSPDTCQNPALWAEDRPSTGQCAVSALLLQEIAGGAIVRAKAVQPDGTAVSHWLNLIDGDFVDLTGDQFPRETRIIFADGAPMTTAQAQAYAFSAGDTRQRFERLKNRVVANFSPRN